MGAKSNIKDRPNSYEVFGIDYMIDTNFNTWLIEINKNPALEYSTVSMNFTLQRLVLMSSPCIAYYGTHVKGAVAEYSGFGRVVLLEELQYVYGETATRSEGDWATENDLSE